VYTWEPRGDWYHSMSFGLDYKDFDEKTRFGTNTDFIPLRYVPITLSYNGFRTTESSQSIIDLSLLGASRSFLGIGSDTQKFDDKRYLANPSFLALTGNLSHTQDVLG